MMLPNIYDFATSELSQDATLAYILSWAKPEYRESHAKLNQLGEKLLHALVEASAEARGSSSPLEDTRIATLEVGTQIHNVDIRVVINDALCLIIEDKVETDEHSNQIERYKRYAESEENREYQDVMAVYVKTGNQSQRSLPKAEKCGVFLRSDLLAVLSETPDTGNTIVEEFRRHLQRWQKDTAAFRHDPHRSWGWRAKQGYYLALGEWLREHHKNDAVDGKCTANWGYISNPSGGFLGFWWHWRPLPSLGCELYLQIEDALRLQIRARAAKDENGERIKVHKGLLYAALGAIKTCADQPRFDGLYIRKSGRYRGGNYATVADITFEAEASTYLAVTEEGTLDMPATQRRLLRAMELVDAVCSDGK